MVIQRILAIPLSKKYRWITVAAMVALAIFVKYDTFTTQEGANSSEGSTFSFEEEVVGGDGTARSLLGENSKKTRKKKKHKKWTGFMRTLQIFAGLTDESWSSCDETWGFRHPDPKDGGKMKFWVFEVRDSNNEITIKKFQGEQFKEAAADPVTLERDSVNFGFNESTPDAFYYYPSHGVGGTDNIGFSRKKTKWDKNYENTHWENKVGSKCQCKLQTMNTLEPVPNLKCKQKEEKQEAEA